MTPTASPDGLTTREALARLSRFGSNDPAPSHGRSAIFQFILLFLNPLVLILLIAAGASALLGQRIDASIIVAVVISGTGVNFVQTYRAQLAVATLRSRVAPSATVLRDGVFQEIPRQGIVPGDIIRLTAGDLVPADARLIASRDLYANQAALTGESVPAEKNANPSAGEDSNPNAPHMVFLGTSIVAGNATALVTATGQQTAFGDIAAHLTARPPDTEYERGLRRFGGLVTRVVFFLVLFILIVSIALHRDPLQSLLFAVALAVGLTPEFLPMITSVTLAKGALAMARENVIVKRLPAIQNLGSIDVLCSDKTGTLTTGVMTLQSHVDALGEPSERSLTLAWLNSHFETGIRNPLDTAISACSPAGVEEYRKQDEIPFDFDRRRASVVIVPPVPEKDWLLITKGAPEGVIPLVTRYESGGQVLPMGPDVLQHAHQVCDGFCAIGLRVLAVASRRVEQRVTYSVADEHDLTLAGFLAFADPPVTGVDEVLAGLQRDGVQIRIITGDSDLVTRHVCDQVGFSCGDIVLGEQIARTSDTALGYMVENTNVFARVSPSQKTRILMALRNRGHVVGFMGDGINDAPSLRAADVGISVSTAVDVARDAADIILTEPGLGVLHRGIIEGRKAFGNVTKYLLMGTSSNFGNMFSMAAAALFLPFLPMLPTQILLNNFLYDVAQVTIPTDNVDEEYVIRPHRWNIELIRNFMLAIGPVSSIFDFLTFFVLLHFLRAPEAEFHTGWFVESLATQILVLFVIRTRRSPWNSRPSRALLATTLATVSIGLLIPYTPFAASLGFTRLPALYFAFLAPAIVAYLLLVEFAKRKLFQISRL